MSAHDAVVNAAAIHASVLRVARSSSVSALVVDGLLQRDLDCGRLSRRKARKEIAANWRWFCRTSRTAAECVAEERRLIGLAA